MLNMNFDKKVVIETQQLNWTESPKSGVWRKPLAREEAERGHATSLVKFEAGAQFIISPGFTPSLLAHAKTADIPLIPGVATPSEVIRAIELGYAHLKFFPASAFGGPSVLKAIAAPLPQVQFCPTGGINPQNVNDYTALDCVATVGGSWMLPKEAIAAKDWAKVTRLAKEAVELIK